MQLFVWDPVPPSILERLRRRFDQLSDVELGVLVVLGGRKAPPADLAMVDIGFANAQRLSQSRNPVQAAEALLRQALVASVTYRRALVVVPDAFGRGDLTADIAEHVARLVTSGRLRIRQGVELCFPVHELDKTDYVRRVVEAASRLGARVCVPSHVMDLSSSMKIPCKSSPTVCISRIARFAKEVGNIHVLGPPLTVAVRISKLPGVSSIDATAYRRAPTEELRRLNGGYTSPRSPVASLAWGVYWVLRVAGVDKEVAEAEALEVARHVVRVL